MHTVPVIPLVRLCQSVAGQVMHLLVSLDGHLQQGIAHTHWIVLILLMLIAEYVVYRDNIDYNTIMVEVFIIRLSASVSLVSIFKK